MLEMEIWNIELTNISHTIEVDAVVGHCFVNLYFEKIEKYI